MNKNLRSILINAFLIISFLFILITLISCTEEQKPLYSDLKIDHSMTVQKFSGTPPSSVAVVSGTVKNMGEETIEVVSLVVIFYDKNGNMIDKSSAITSFLQPEGVWNFSIKSEGTEAWKIVDYSISSSSTP